MQAVSNFKPETIDAFKKIYSEYKEAINFKAKFGNPTEKAFALTVLTVAGVDTP
ncbi:hypothetical protein [Methanosarcina acetivorans]|uniref:hypothetical protein n=1 Tax=Methanosarcina acetivorans TaxID=2214 RepID=UPI000ADCB8DB|nr:hypothetical protein [Methanosarcina acetivorans]